ncbi:hypothetical protein [Wenxinia marina]|nr:hypothetical protein [Wenxinia marina]
MRLRAGLGPQESAVEVGQLRERLIELRRRIAETLAEGRWHMVAEAAAGVAELGCRLGVPELHQAGRNLADCARGADGTALVATAGRVLRLSDRAVTAVGALRRESD